MANTCEQLFGGNLTNVFKLNDTVLREQKPWSSTIHKVLLHLEKVGYANNPRFLGIDDNGKEILSFVQGECVADYPFTNDNNEQLLVIRKIAEMMRKLHDATQSFERSEEDNWMLSYKGPLKKEVICHNDIAPYNVTFINNLPYGLIDFDTCCPTPRIWDIAYALYRFVPFSKRLYDIEEQAYRDYDAQRDRDFRRKSIHVFFDEYGIDCPDDLFEQMIQRLKALADLIYDEAQNGNSSFIKMMEEGYRDLYLGEIEFIKENQKEWL